MYKTSTAGKLSCSAVPRVPSKTQLLNRYHLGSNTCLAVSNPTYSILLGKGEGERGSPGSPFLKVVLNSFVIPPRLMCLIFSMSRKPSLEVSTGKEESVLKSFYYCGRVRTLYCRYNYRLFHIFFFSFFAFRFYILKYQYSIFNKLLISYISKYLYIRAGFSNKHIKKKVFVDIS